MSTALQVLRANLPEPAKAVLRILRRLYHAMLGERLRLRQTLRRNYKYDAQRFERHATLGQGKASQIKLRVLITLDVHRLEKGLALRAPRAWFGQQTVTRLTKTLRTYLDVIGADATTRSGVDVLRSYYRFHQVQGLRDEKLETMLQELEQEQVHTGVLCADDQAGIIPVTRAQIHKQGKIDITGFFASRHSTRQFDPRPVEPGLIAKAVSLAIFTPSVCNRQPWKVRVYGDHERKQQIFLLQNGNRGFHEEISVLLVVTGDLQSFVSIGERNQAWIDGGMFSMSLVLALHSLGLGTCCLNWSVTEETDRQLRVLLQLPESEVVIMFVAVGHIPERLMVARSTRKPLDEVMLFNAAEA